MNPEFNQGDSRRRECSFLNWNCRTIDNLYILLLGDFDGRSAAELINAMKGDCNEYQEKIS